MGLLEELAGSVMRGGTAGAASSDQVGALLRNVFDALDGDPDGAGLDGLQSRFDRAGQGDVFGSWVGTGQNRSIGADVLTQILRGSPLESAPQRAGIGGAAGAAVLAQLLPTLIDKLTPKGQVPQRTQVREMGDDILRGGSPFARPEGLGIMSEEKKRPDFSNVQSGASSTAAPPKPAAKPAEPRTYTVAAGDSLSKIAKRLYGDANQWKRIFEANKDTIKNPDLIHPGQVLRIPDKE